MSGEEEKGKKGRQKREGRGRGCGPVSLGGIEKEGTNP